MHARFAIARTLVALAAAFAAPAPAPAADLVEHAVTAECTGVITTPGSGQCRATFDFDRPGFVSNIDTHGNLHAILAENGSVSLTWLDALGNKVFTVQCNSTGLYVAPAGTGPLDVQNATCASQTVSATYVEGVQTLVVDALTTGCLESPTCTFHGKLSISASDALI